VSYIAQDLSPQARGDTWFLKFIIQGPSGESLDLTGKEYWVTLKSDINLSDQDAELIYGPVTPQSPEAEQGILNITIPSNYTNDLEAKNYNYDLQEVSPGNIVSTLLIGKIKVRADVTRSTAGVGGDQPISRLPGQPLYQGIIWDISGSGDELRRSVEFKDEDGTISTVRTASFVNGLLELELASFSAGVSASGQSRSWDQPATQWSVSVVNPDDFPSQYIASTTATLTGISGIIHPTIADYTTTGPSPTPAGTVDWSQTFTTNGSALIYSNSSSLSGGSASATVSFVDNNDNVFGTTAGISFSWSTANVSINFSNLSGATFLQTYASTGYSVSISGLSNSGNAVSTVSGVGGNVSNTSGSGTFTFTTPIHKNNNGGRSVSVSTDFSRPASVTGTAYTVTDTASDSSITASFTYPSFWLFTASTSSPPARADIVNGNGFEGTVNVLGNQSKNIDTFITNGGGIPQAFWLCIRSSATQPTSFQTGASAALLSDVAVTTGYSVALEPDASPAGYIAENYTLYGITLQPGDTYVRIS